MLVKKEDSGTEAGMTNGRHPERLMPRMILTNLVALNFRAVFQRIDAEFCAGWGVAVGGHAFVQPECRRVPAFGKARRTGVHNKHTLEVLFEFPDMRMTVKIRVNLAAAVFEIGGF